jgi:hypothetical protein
MVSHMLNALSSSKTIVAAFRHSSLLVFVCCVLVTAIVLVRTNVLTSGWSPILEFQTLILFSAVGSVAAVTVMFLRLKQELLLSLIAIVMIALFCGPAPTAIVLFFLSSAACLASVLFIPFGGSEAIPFNLRIVVGWGLFAIIFTLLASIKIHTTAIHILMLAIPILAAIAIPIIRETIWSRARELFRPSTGATAPGLLYATGLVVCIVVLSFHLALVALPERNYDALAMHLYVPSFVAGHRAWNFDINNYVFAYWPMAVDFLYTNVFLLQGEQAARLLNFVALILTCFAVFQIAVRTCSRTAAIWAVVLFVSMPLTLTESTSLFIEHTIALFIVSAVLALILSGFRVTLLDYAVVLILLTAAAMSKLFGALGAVVIGTTASALYLRQRRQRSEYLMFSIVSLVAVGIALWPYIYSWRYTGNPFFPFLNRVFKSPYWPVENFDHPILTGKFSPWLLFDTTFHSSRFLEAGDGALGFSLFVFLAAGFVGAIYRRNAIVTFCVGVGLLIIGVISLQIQYLRYYFIFIPLLMVGVAFALDELRRPLLWRVPVAAIVAMVVLLNVFKFPSANWVIGASDLRGAFDSDVRREIELGYAPERIVNRIINDIAGSDAKVLYLTNPYAALLVGTAIYDNWYNVAHARDIAQIKTEKDFETVLHRIAPTYVIFDSTKKKQNYTIAGNYLQSNAILVTSIGRLLLYRISPESK